MSQTAPMRKVASTVGGILVVVVVLGLAVDTGSVKPPDDALVYLNPSQSTYFPPTRTPSNSGYIPVSYAEARRRGAKPDDVQGFNIDGPPLLISALETVGVLPEWPRYWLGTNTTVEKFR